MLHLVEVILKGGFGILIARLFISNVNDIFNKRSREVQVAKMLKHEIEKNISSITKFLASVETCIETNKGVTNGVYSCVGNANPPSFLVFENNYAQIFYAFETYSKGTIENLNEVYSAIKNYEILIDSYRELYLKTSAINLRNDPNVKYQNIALNAGLLSVDGNAEKVFGTIALIHNGKWYWRALKNYQLHKVLVLLFGLLFIGIPRTDEL